MGLKQEYKVMRCVPYKRDDSMQLRLSHENHEIIKLYEEFYGEPLSELAEQMLHTVYFDRSADLGGVYIADRSSVCSRFKTISLQGLRLYLLQACKIISPAVWVRKCLKSTLKV